MNNQSNNSCCYDVIVVGGGHAGIEAALIAARSGCSVLMISSKKNSIGIMPCNPSIGGLAKSHLVYELDALGGQMAFTTDLCGIQFKTLNLSRGPAVWATRVQCDKKAYAKTMQKILAQTANLEILEDTVDEILLNNNTANGVLTKNNGKIDAKTVVITAGTAIEGKEFIGHHGIDGAGDGRPPSIKLAESLSSLKFKLTRLKTGTPPRLYRESIDFDKTVEQPGETPPPFLSLHTEMFHVEHYGQQCSTWNIAENKLINNEGSNQIICYMSHTNERTHKIIRDNLKESSLYGGEIVGTGVRYCPSIEDKIVKFTGVNAHHVMLEPEGLSDDDYIYPNGLSNSLPEKAQVDMVHSVEGLERAEFAKFGYAIEYSGIDSRELKSTLESKRIKCLYFAGQVNGTTGYEEAAAQGIIAGANAALKVQNREPLILSRNDAYIGVLIDDLITKGTNEPYRMFTSRAERRLILRQDNARYRLKNAAEKIGVLDKLLCDKINRDNLTVEKIIDFLDNSYYHNKSLSGILSRPGVKLVQMIEDFKNKFESLPESVKENITSHVIKQTEIRVKYRGYIELEEKEVERDKKQENEKIPESFDYFSVDALRYESREKLSQVKPETLAQASRISGVTPADIAVLSTILYKNKKLSTKDK